METENLYDRVTLEADGPPAQQTLSQKRCPYCGTAIKQLRTVGGRLLHVNAAADRTGTVALRMDGSAAVLNGDEADAARLNGEVLYAGHQCAGSNIYRQMSRS